MCGLASPPKPPPAPPGAQDVGHPRGGQRHRPGPPRFPRRSAVHESVLAEDLAEVMKYASLCALGQTAPNPVLSTIRYFRDEYEAHIREKRCPACVCKDLLTYVIDAEKCEACGLCEKNCPSKAIYKDEEGIYTIHQEECIKCGNCFSVCPEKFRAVVKNSSGMASETPQISVVMKGM